MVWCGGQLLWSSRASISQNVHVRLFWFIPALDLDPYGAGAVVHTPPQHHRTSTELLYSVAVNSTGCAECVAVLECFHAVAQLLVISGLFVPPPTLPLLETGPRVIMVACTKVPYSSLMQ